MSEQPVQSISNDPRTQDERAVDERYNAMIERVLGHDAADRPMKDFLGSEGPGGLIVLTDPADLGFQYSEPLSGDEQENQVEIARAAVQRSYVEIPLVDGE